jgi:hypothetical protein
MLLLFTLFEASGAERIPSLPLSRTRRESGCWPMSIEFAMRPLPPRTGIAKQKPDFVWKIGKITDLLVP